MGMRRRGVDKKRLGLTALVLLLLVSVPAFHFYRKSITRRIASRYLKAARRNDLAALKELSYPTHWSDIAAKGVAVRPLSWKFISEERISLRKKEFDLSPAAYKKEVASALHLYNEPSVDKLRNAAIKAHLISFASWRAENISAYGLFEENGRAYFNDATPRAELVYGITEESGKPPVEYLLALEQKSSGGGKWEVTEFTKR